MERLVLGLIAVIGLHTAFVVYMAGIRRVDQNAEIAAGGDAVVASRRLDPKAPADPQPQSSAEPLPTKASPAAPAVTERGHARSRTLRADSIQPAEITSRRHYSVTRAAKTIPAFSARTSTGAKNHEVTFGDRVIVYNAPVQSSMRRPVAAAALSDNRNPRRSSNSLVAKLQWVYKKPWGLMKAVASKLR